MALTAGLAALWLERVGWEAARREARRRGNLPVQELFRAALRITEDDADLMTNPVLGNWAGMLLPTRALWRPLVRAVGRIDVRDHLGRWLHAATGFVMPGERVMTNRHVLDVFAEPLPAPPGAQAFHLRRAASIVFDPAAEDDATRFDLGPVVTAGAERIGRVVDLARLDMAVLEVAGHNGAAALPDPIPFSTGGGGTGGDGDEVLCIGYPARPGFSQVPAGADEALAFWDRVGAICGDAFGVKSISPGAVMDRAGAVAGDPRGWAISHDATTFAGSSGSAVLRLGGGCGLRGLHFGGAVLTMNLAHDIAAVRARGDGTFDPRVLGDG